MLKLLRLNHFSLIVVTLLPLSILQANPFTTPLPFKEGIVHYRITGFDKGTETIYIKDFGKKRVIYKSINSKIMHHKEENETLIMIDEMWTYHINLTKKVATKEPSLNKLLIKKFNSLTKEEQDFIEAKKDKYILGMACHLCCVDGVCRYYTNEGHLMLQSQTDILGYQVSTSASSIQQRDINDSLFVLPAGLKIIKKEADETRADKIIQALLKEQVPTAHQHTMHKTLKLLDTLTAQPHK